MSTGTTITPRSSAVGKPLRVLAWLSFIGETIIIGTGGAVRLTGSGLGCSEWPLCTPESLVPTPEQGWHGVIEFGNRTLTGVVLALALGVLLWTLHHAAGRRAVTRTLWWAGGSIVAAAAVSLGVYALGGHGHETLEDFMAGAGIAWLAGTVLLGIVVAAVDSIRRIPVRRDLNVLAWIVLAGVMMQALVGGITVLTGLNPAIVGFHYASSLVLVCITAAFLVRMYQPDAPREPAAPRWYRILAHLTGLALVATIFFGVLTTGSGPHSGDANVIRTGFDASFMAHVHSWPGYVLAGLAVLLAVGAFMLNLDARWWALTLIAAVGVQVIVGVWQAREGLPEVLVGIHMVLAALSAATYTVLVLRLRRPVTSDSVAAAPAETVSARA